MIYRLAGGPAAGQYGAVRMAAPSRLTEWPYLRVTTTADGAARVWIQLRRSGPGDGERWGRSVAVGPGRRAEWVRFDEFIPLGAGGAGAGPRPPLDGIDDLLVVIDTVNTAPGAAGSVTVWDLSLGR
jgi:hypothetical protein